MGKRERDKTPKISEPENMTLKNININHRLWIFISTFTIFSTTCYRPS